MRFIKNTPEPAAAGAPAGAAATAPAEREERILGFGDVFGRDAGGLIVLLVLFGGMTLASTEFLTGDNLANLARQVAVFGIIAVGQLLVILTAGIDLSVGSVLGLTGCVSAELLVHGWGIVPAIVVGLLIGAAIGMFNGALVAFVKLPPFIVTLGMLGIARCVVLVLTDASTVQPLPDAFGAVYSVAGVLAAGGGLLFTRPLNAGTPTAGTGYELNAIAACVIGGASLFGAKGGAFGAAAGALIVGVLNNGGNLLAINSFYLQIIIGALILAAVAFDQWQGGRSPAARPAAAPPPPPRPPAPPPPPP